MTRVALVTGGLRGIGECIALNFKKLGYKVAVNTKNLNDELKAKLGFEDILKIECDVSDFDACQNCSEKIKKELGPVDILVNNAGIVADGMMHKMQQHQWQKVISVNLDSVFNMSRAVINNMREKNFGRIINLSSVNALKGQFGQVNYSAAKAGIIGFTKALALESARKGITVNSVAPGYINTNMLSEISPEVMKKIVEGIPLGRLGTVQEIADVVCFLASDKASYITGETISANGGQYMQ